VIGAANTSPWEQQVKGDAAAMLTYMREVRQSDPARTFSIAELSSKLALSRARVGAGLAVLVIVEKTVGVTNERVDQARFYPITP
jgi:hypothetical protein